MFLKVAKKLSKIKENQGSLTLEACISFSMTFLVIISFMFFIKIVYVHSIMQHAVTQTANELANYSYLYSVSPLAPINDAVVDSTAGNIDRLNNDIQEVVDVWDSVVTLKKTGGTAIEASTKAVNSDYADITNSLQEAEGALADINASGEAALDAYNQAGQAISTIKVNAENPKDLLKAVVSVFVSGANEDAKTFLGSIVAKGLMEKYIAEPGKPANQRLLSLQVIGGIDGLDFSASRYFSDKQNIDLVVCYQMKNITPLKIMPDIYLINRATVRGWLNDGGPSRLTN